MSESETTAFLRQGTRTGKLSINLASGTPTVTPVWFVIEDDGVIRFTTSVSSPKIRALRQDPRACLLVDLEEPPYAYVRVSGEVKIVDDDPELTKRVATAARARYKGSSEAQEKARSFDSEGKVVVELKPTRIVALNDIST